MTALLTERPVAGVRQDDGLTPIGDVRWRQVVRVRGVVASLRVVGWVEPSPVLECTVFDETGGISLVFLGRRAIGGLSLGTHIEAEGRVIESRARLAIMNPIYELRAPRR